MGEHNGPQVCFGMAYRSDHPELYSSYMHPSLPPQGAAAPLCAPSDWPAQDYISWTDLLQSTALPQGAAPNLQQQPCGCGVLPDCSFNPTAGDGGGRLSPTELLAQDSGPETGVNIATDGHAISGLGISSEGVNVSVAPPTHQIQETCEPTQQSDYNPNIPLTVYMHSVASPCGTDSTPNSQSPCRFSDSSSKSPKGKDSSSDGREHSWPPSSRSMKRARITSANSPSSRPGPFSLPGPSSTAGLPPDEPMTPMDMDDDDDRELGEDEKDGRGGGSHTRLNHSEIEKRRRDKMNTYIMELARIVPMCRDMNRKMDKLTVLRLAVQHINSLRGETNTHTEVNNLPAFITDRHITDLILQAAEGFLLAISCDRGKILYASESTKNILNFRQPELIGQNLFDFIHHEDISKVKDQLTSNDFMPKERYIDAKTIKLIKTRLPRTHLQLRSGGRRMFVCRMKQNPLLIGSAGACPPPQPPPPATLPGIEEELSELVGWATHAQTVKQEPGATLNPARVRDNKRKLERRSYTTVLCIGYIKPWVTSKSAGGGGGGNGAAGGSAEEADQDGDSEAVNLNSLIAVAIPLGGAGSPRSETTTQDECCPTLSESELRNPIPEFMSRHTIDGKFIYVDHRVTGVLGYVPQELTGTSVYEYCHKDSVQSFSELHEQVLKTKEKLDMRSHRFRAKDGSYVSLGTSALVFSNPWTKEREQVVCTHRLLEECSVTSSSEETNTKVKTRVKSPASPASASLSEKEVSDIGRRIADEVDREGSPGGHYAVDSSTRGAGGPLRGAGGTDPSPSKRACAGLHITSTTSGSSSQRDSSSGAETTDEAAIEMIMNLLEADAGLGGPVDFNDLPWPL